MKKKFSFSEPLIAGAARAQRAIQVWLWMAIIKISEGRHDKLSLPKSSKQFRVMPSEFKILQAKVEILLSNFPICKGLQFNYSAILPVDGWL